MRHRLPSNPPPDPAPRPISPEQARRVARLARLELTDEQADRYADQLSRVLAYVEQLRALDLEGVAPLLHPHDGFAIPAPDAPIPGLLPEQVAKLAPDSLDAAGGVFIRVPKVLGGSADGGGG